MLIAVKVLKMESSSCGNQDIKMIGKGFSPYNVDKIIPILEFVIRFKGFHINHEIRKVRG